MTIQAVSYHEPKIILQVLIHERLTTLQPISDDNYSSNLINRLR